MYRRLVKITLTTSLKPEMWFQKQCLGLGLVAVCSWCWYSTPCSIFNAEAYCLVNCYMMLFLHISSKRSGIVGFGLNVVSSSWSPDFDCFNDAQKW